MSIGDDFEPAGGSQGDKSLTGRQDHFSANETDRYADVIL